jgi:hypothetical protein
MKILDFTNKSVVGVIGLYIDNVKYMCGGLKYERLIEVKEM